MNLSIDLIETKEKTTLKLTGEIDIFTAQKLKDELYQAIDKAEKHIEIDLAGVTYLDSTGLGTFISGLKKTKEDGKLLKLIQANERVYRLFKVTGLNSVIEVEASNEVGVENGDI